MYPVCALRASTLRTVEPPSGSTTGYRHAVRHRHCIHVHKLIPFFSEGAYEAYMYRGDPIPS